jgi:hypothetical protein
MSRASWYRHGKPSEKPKRTTVADAARAAGVSVRTHQRIMRVIDADADLAAMMLNQGWCRPGRAERIIADPAEHRRFRRWLTKQAKGLK